MMIALLAFVFPTLTAIFLGYRAGRDTPQSLQDVGYKVLWMVGWATATAILWHAAWISALMPAPWYDTLWSALIWAFATGAIWFPLMIITFVIFAMRARRA